MFFLETVQRLTNGLILLPRLTGILHQALIEMLCHPVRRATAAFHPICASYYFQAERFDEHKRSTIYLVRPTSANRSLGCLTYPLRTPFAHVCTISSRGLRLYWPSAKGPPFLYAHFAPAFRPAHSHRLIRSLHWPLYGAQGTPRVRKKTCTRYFLSFRHFPVLTL